MIKNTERLLKFWETRPFPHNLIDMYGGFLLTKHEDSVEVLFIDKNKDKAQVLMDNVKLGKFPLITRMQLLSSNVKGYHSTNVIEFEKLTKVWVVSLSLHPTRHYSGRKILYERDK